MYIFIYICICIYNIQMYTYVYICTLSYVPYKAHALSQESYVLLCSPMSGGRMQWGSHDPPKRGSTLSKEFYVYSLQYLPSTTDASDESTFNISVTNGTSPAVQARWMNIEPSFFFSFTIWSPPLEMKSWITPAWSSSLCVYLCCVRMFVQTPRHTHVYIYASFFVTRSVLARRQNMRRTKCFVRRPVRLHLYTNMHNYTDIRTRVYA